MNENITATEAVIEPAEVLTIDQTDAFVMPSAYEDGAGQPGRFRIVDDDVADWAIQKVADARAEYARLKELADREISRITAKVEAAAKRCEQDTAYLTSCLAEYFESVPEKAKKATKTTVKYKLLHGTLTVKKGGVTYARDDAKLLAWLKENGHSDLVRVKEEPAWGELKKQIEATGSMAVMKETGEVIDGIEAGVAGDLFTIEA